MHAVPGVYLEVLNSAGGLGVYHGYNCHTANHHLEWRSSQRIACDGLHCTHHKIGCHCHQCCQDCRKHSTAHRRQYLHDEASNMQ